MIIAGTAAKPIISAEPEVEIVLGGGLEDIGRIAAELDVVLVDGGLVLGSGRSWRLRRRLVPLVFDEVHRTYVGRVRGGRSYQMPVVDEHEIVLSQVSLPNARKEDRAVAVRGVPTDQHAGVGVLKVELLGLDVHDGEVIEHPRPGSEIQDHVVAAVRRDHEGISSWAAYQEIVAGTAVEITVTAAVVEHIVARTSHEPIGLIPSNQPVVARPADQMVRTGGTDEMVIAATADPA
nr:hypothetical protein [Bradyrhizobium diazoefficiens]